jgi:hypothetical protein
MMGSVRKALKADGCLVIVDLDRIEGRSRQWVLDHVRAGKNEVVAELRTGGFECGDLPVGGLTENYVLQCRKRR